MVPAEFPAGPRPSRRPAPHEAVHERGPGRHGEGRHRPPCHRGRRPLGLDPLRHARRGAGERPAGTGGRLLRPDGAAPRRRPADRRRRARLQQPADRDSRLRRTAPAAADRPERAPRQPGENAAAPDPGEHQHHDRSRPESLAPDGRSGTDRAGPHQPRRECAGRDAGGRAAGHPDLEPRRRRPEFRASARNGRGILAAALDFGHRHRNG